MKKLYDSKEKRTVLRLLLWFLLIAGNVHFYYTQNVAWAIETPSRIETMILVTFIDVTLFLSLLIWQNWDGFDSEILIRYLFSFGLSILSYVVFYPAFYNYIHSIAKIKGVYTLSGHPVVLTGYAVLALIAAFWTFTGMFPTEAISVYHGRERKKRFLGSIISISNLLDMWIKSRMNKKLIFKKTENTEIIDINLERERIKTFKT